MTTDLDWGDLPPLEHEDLPLLDPAPEPEVQELPHEAILTDEAVTTALDEEEPILLPTVSPQLRAKATADRLCPPVGPAALFNRRTWLQDVLETVYHDLTQDPNNERLLQLLTHTEGQLRDTGLHMAIINQIEAERARQKVSLKTLAQAARCSKSSASNDMNGYGPVYERLFAYLTALNIDFGFSFLSVTQNTQTTYPPLMPGLAIATKPDLTQEQEIIDDQAG